MRSVTLTRAVLWYGFERKHGLGHGDTEMQNSLKELLSREEGKRDITGSRHEIKGDLLLFLFLRTMFTC